MLKGRVFRALVRPIHAIRKRFLVCVAVSACCGAAFPASASAVVYLDCISNAKGQRVRWSQYWEPDKSDNDVVYKIATVSEIDKIPLREITLDLQAEGPAAHSSRRIVIATEEKARAVCERLVEAQRVLRFPDVRQDDLTLLPFIKFTRDGWMRADRDSEVELVVCRVGDQRYSCPATDHARFSNGLKTLEDELKAQVK